jgi:hypothetical protein
MKLEALEKALATARDQARVLEKKAQESDLVAITAKNDARQAKSKSKLAKQKAKRARKAAKEAKRTSAEALCASERADVEVAALEKRIAREQTKAQQADGEKIEQPIPVAHKRTSGNSHPATSRSSELKAAIHSAPGTAS